MYQVLDYTASDNQTVDLQLLTEKHTIRKHIYQ